MVAPSAVWCAPQVKGSLGRPTLWVHCTVMSIDSSFTPHFLPPKPPTILLSCAVSSVYRHVMCSLMVADYVWCPVQRWKWRRLCWTDRSTQILPYLSQSCLLCNVLWGPLRIWSRANQSARYRTSCLQANAEVSMTCIVMAKSHGTVNYH